LRVADDVAQFYERVEEIGLPAELDSRARDILEPLFAIAALADAESERQTYYPKMVTAAEALAGVRADADGYEASMVAAAKALHAYGGERDFFVISGRQAFDLFRETDDLRWVDSEKGAKSVLRRLGFGSSSHRRDLFVRQPADTGGVARGYRVERARLGDVLARYDSVAPRESPA
jgi:hypothetical protein